MPSPPSSPPVVQLVMNSGSNLLFLLLPLLVGVQGAPSGASQNMNGEYLISNPHPSSPNKFSTEYSSYENVEYFDVYSPPISSRYGEVYWTMMDAVPLDENLVKRFSGGKIMAIVGYETDQVMRTPEGDVSVPITWAYNHHFEAYLAGALSEVRLTTAAESGKNDHHGAHALWHAFKREDIGDPNGDSEIPTAQWFSEGNGGEFRKSYHGYPKGMAQLIESPKSFSIEPMQIDTKNRFYNGSDFRPGVLPAQSAAPPNASYSGLLECPCSTRIPRNISVTFATQFDGSCDKDVVHSAEICFKEAAGQMGVGKVINSTEVNTNSLPSGCLIQVNSDGDAQLFYNNYIDSPARCAEGTKTNGNINSPAVMVNVSIGLDASVSDGKATITMSGPNGKWFGLGLNTPKFSMADLPYTIVVDGSGNVSEKKLGNHSPGNPLKQSIRVTANSVVDGVRTVIVERAFAGASTDYYTFDPKATSLDVILASGEGPTYAYHGAKQRTGGTIHFTAEGVKTCVCNAGVQGTINNIPFSKNCLPEPKGDLLVQKNPTCFADTYQGGLACCHHEVVLLDTDQPQPTDVLTYHMKFRFWFQEYSQATEEKASASHQNLIRIYWQTEALAGEYDVTQCPAGSPSADCVQAIHSNFTVRDMMSDCDIRKNPGCWGNTTAYEGINLIYAAGHCHAPSCILMELWNADTNELLCRHDPVYGKTHEVFDELGYLAIPPCLYGPEEEGLMPPTFLSYDTNLYSVKKNNNTYTHYGEMASWQMRGILVNK